MGGEGNTAVPPPPLPADLNGVSASVLALEMLSADNNISRVEPRTGGRGGATGTQPTTTVNATSRLEGNNNVEAAQHTRSIANNNSVALAQHTPRSENNGVKLVQPVLDDGVGTAQVIRNTGVEPAKHTRRLNSNAGIEPARPIRIDGLGSAEPIYQGRKRRKSTEAGGWRSRYNAEEFESGEALASSQESEDTGGEQEVNSPGTTTKRRGVEGGEWDDAVVDVGGDDDDGGGDGNGGMGSMFVAGSGGGGGGDWLGAAGEPGGVARETSAEEGLGVGEGAGVAKGTGKGTGAWAEDGALAEAEGDGEAEGEAGAQRKRRKKKKKREPANAWKRRCADGNCQLGASFGAEGKAAVYCSAHKDPGMINVTHRRCDEPG